MTENEFNQLFPNFNLSELACNDAQNTPVPNEFISNYAQTIKVLQFIRALFDTPIIINSGYRTPEYNKAIKGSKRSLHTYDASAIDFRLKGANHGVLTHIFEALDFAQRSGMIHAGGLHLYHSFVHIDFRSELARW